VQGSGPTKNLWEVKKNLLYYVHVSSSNWQRDGVKKIETGLWFCIEKSLFGDFDMKYDTVLPGLYEHSLCRLSLMKQNE
jgi:hypothetical protein